MNVATGGARMDACRSRPSREGRMKLVGLGGGIGSGKSTVSLLLAESGAAIVDADLIARKVVEPGTPALAELADRFGNGVLAADGSLNRQALADIVFKDPEALKALNGITHPAIGREMVAQVVDLASLVEGA